MIRKINFNIFNSTSSIIIALRYPFYKLSYPVIVLFMVKHFIGNFNFRLHLLIIFKFIIIFSLILFIFHVNPHCYIEILVYYVFNQILSIVFIAIWKNCLPVIRQIIAIKKFIFHIVEKNLFFILFILFR